MNYAQRQSVEITAERLRYVLYYESSSGVFTWRVSTSNNSPVGSKAGTVCHGYCVISIDSHRYYASNLAWLFMTGEWPDKEVEHADGDSGNDRWSNLRLATRSQNMANARRLSNNTSGSRGVSWHKKNQKWQAYVTLRGKRTYCGYFDTIEEAKAARDAKASLLHGEFARFDNLSQGVVQ